MAMLVEAISGIARRETIDEIYAGGWPAFVAITNQTLCAGAAPAALAPVGCASRVGAISQVLANLDPHDFVQYHGFERPGITEVGRRQMVLAMC